MTELPRVVGSDPANTEIELLTAPLDPDDDVFSLIEATGEPVQLETVEETEEPQK